MLFLHASFSGRRRRGWLLFHITQNERYVHVTLVSMCCRDVDEAVANGKNWVVDSETPAGLAGQTLHQMFCGELHRHATAANSRWSRPKMSGEARWPITLGGLYYGVLPKASHGELCPSPFVVIDLEPAPTQRAGIYQRAVSGFPARHRSGGRYHTTTGRLHLTPLPKQTNNTAPTTPLRTSDDSKQIDPGRFRTSPSSTEV